MTRPKKSLLSFFIFTLFCVNLFQDETVGVASREVHVFGGVLFFVQVGMASFVLSATIGFCFYDNSPTKTLSYMGIEAFSQQILSQKASVCLLKISGG